jgi:hypothetical protein
MLKQSALKASLVLSFLASFLGLAFPVFSASYKETAEPEIIVPKPGIASTDFEIEYRPPQESPSVTTPVSLPGEERSSKETQYQNQFREGNLSWSQYNYPDFSRMESSINTALKQLLPQAIGENLTITGGDNLSGQAKHYVFGRFQEEERGSIIEDPSPEKIPEEKISVPKKWPRIIGGTKILGGLLGAFKAPKSVIINIVNPVNTEAPPRKTGHPNDSTLVSSSQADKIVENEEFKTRSLLQKIINHAVEFFRDILTTTDEEGNVITVSSWFKKEKQEITSANRDPSGKLTLANKTRGTVPGLETINEQSTLFNSFVPTDIVEGKDNQISGHLAVKAQYEASSNYYPQEGSEKTVFQNLGTTVRNYCLALCSQYPSGYPINNLDPLCPSCDPDDYELTGYGDVILNKDLCRPDESGACHYYQPYDGTNQGCEPGQDPICEGEDEKGNPKCNPYEFYTDDYVSKCNKTPWYGDCRSPDVCYIMTFPHNPAGGYGECQYANPQVCVRADRIQVGECAAVCNWACCSEQE